MKWARRPERTVAMTRELETLKRRYTDDYLRRRGVDVDAARTKNTVCPVCGNGSRTGCFHYYQDSFRVKCFSCGFAGDLFDLIAQERGLDNAGAIQAAKAMYGPQTGDREREPRPEPQMPAAVTSQTQQAQKDYTDFLLQAEKDNDFVYLARRGIIDATQCHFHVGYCAAWVNPRAVETTLQRGGDPGRLHLICDHCTK